MALLRWDDIPTMRHLPFVARAIVGAPPFNGGVKTISFGSSIGVEGPKKAELQKFRELQLRDASARMTFRLEMSYNGMEIVQRLILTSFT